MFGKEKMDQEGQENGVAVDMTPAVNKKSEASKKTNERRKANIKAVCDYIGTLADVPADVLAAKGWLEGTNRSTGGTGAQSVLSKMFTKVGDKLTNLEVFEQYDLSGKDMAKKIKDGVEKGVWVSFENNTYTLVHLGEEAPADWKGPFPKA